MLKKKMKLMKKNNNKNISAEKKVELLKGVIAEKDKIIEKYKKINGEIELTKEDDLIFTLEKCKKEQEEILNELKEYQKRYNNLIQEYKLLINTITDELKSSFH